MSFLTRNAIRHIRSIWQQLRRSRDDYIKMSRFPIKNLESLYLDLEMRWRQTNRWIVSYKVMTSLATSLRHFESRKRRYAFLLLVQSGVLDNSRQKFAYVSLLHGFRSIYQETKTTAACAEEPRCYKGQQGLCKLRQVVYTTQELMA